MHYCQINKGSRGPWQFIIAVSFPTERDGKCILALDCFLIGARSNVCFTLILQWESRAINRANPQNWLWPILDNVFDALNEDNVGWFNPEDWPSVVVELVKCPTGIRTVIDLDPTCCTPCKHMADAIRGKLTGLNGKVYHDICQN